MIQSKKLTLLAFLSVSVLLSSTPGNAGGMEESETASPISILPGGASSNQRRKANFYHLTKSAQQASPQSQGGISRESKAFLRQIPADGMPTKKQALHIKDNVAIERGTVNNPVPENRARGRDFAG